MWVKQGLVEQGMCRQQENNHWNDLTRPCVNNKLWPSANLDGIWFNCQVGGNHPKLDLAVFI